jgi:hypothetical protein
MIVIPSFSGSVSGNVMRYMPVMNQPRPSARGTPPATLTLSAGRGLTAGPVRAAALELVGTRAEAAVGATVGTGADIMVDTAVDTAGSASAGAGIAPLSSER